MTPATELLAELQRVRPAELVFPAENASLQSLLVNGAVEINETNSFPPNARPTQKWILSPYEDWVFAPETALYSVREHFQVTSLYGFGLKDAVLKKIYHDNAAKILRK